LKLYVDDLRKVPDNTWTLARTNTEAIRLLATLHVEEISIDHDICIPRVEFVKEEVRKRLAIGEETFEPVVYYIVLMKPEDRPKKITIHSSNYPASLRMQGILSDVGIDSEYIEGHYNLDANDSAL